jgi:hypothetical protein
LQFGEAGDEQRQRKLRLVAADQPLRIYHDAPFRTVCGRLLGTAVILSSAAAA